jgi:histidinol dehydrogenase
MTVQMISEEGLRTLEDTITTLAEAEGLQAHAQSVRKRFEQR